MDYSEPNRTGLRIFGVGRSSVPILVKRVSMRVGSVEFPVRLAWSQIEDVPLLLGRMDVFRRFEITFKEKEGVTTFSSRKMMHRATFGSATI